MSRAGKNFSKGFSFGNKYGIIKDRNVLMYLRLRAACGAVHRLHLDILKNTYLIPTHILPQKRSCWQNILPATADSGELEVRGKMWELI